MIKLGTQVKSKIHDDLTGSVVILERSIDLQDSEILDDYGHLLDVHTILELAA